MENGTVVIMDARPKYLASSADDPIAPDRFKRNRTAAIPEAAIPARRMRVRVDDVPSLAARSPWMVNTTKNTDISVSVIFAALLKWSGETNHPVPWATRDESPTNIHGQSR